MNTWKCVGLPLLWAAGQGRQCCSGQNITLSLSYCSEWQYCSGMECCSVIVLLLILLCITLGKNVLLITLYYLLLWGETRSNMLWRKYALRRRRKLAKKERILPIFGKIGEILEKLEGISGDFAVKKKRFGRQ